MPTLDDHAYEAAFLRGGGATGDLIAKLDWASTPLGRPGAWPPTLKTATSLVLRSALPMALLWGEDGWMIHNDAYAALVGDNHAQLLGSKVREGWPEIAEFSDHFLKAVLGGATLRYRDQRFTVHRSGKPEQHWLDLDYSPVLDESGRPVGVLAIVVETTARVLAERKAAIHAERQRRMFEQAPGFIVLLSGSNLIVEFVNESHKRLFGDHKAEGRPWREAFADIAALATPGFLGQVYASGERFVGRARSFLLPKPGGQPEEHFLDFMVEPLRDDGGEVTGLFVEGFDVTEQVRAQAAAEESRQRLSAAISVARLGAFEWNLETQEATFDARAREIFGYGPDERIRVWDALQRIDSDAVPHLRANWAAFKAAGRGRREFEYRIHLPDGSTREVAGSSDAIPGPDGRIARVVGVVSDITERRRAEERQRLLINELNHRVKNTLTTVQALAAQTLRSAPDLPSAREAYESRLMALAAAHDLLTEQSWHGARLGDAAAAAMAAFETVQRPQISRSGPPVWLTAQRALALSLALHELATNAVKYGALSRPEGRVTIRWTVSADDELILRWSEQGGPPVAAPVRSGFGTRLLQRSLARELDAEVALSFAPEGVGCEIRCKVEAARPAPIFDPADL